MEPEVGHLAGGTSGSCQGLGSLGRNAAVCCKAQVTGSGALSRQMIATRAYTWVCMAEERCIR